MEASVSLRVGPSASEHLGHVSDAEVVEVVKRMSLLELVVDEMKDGKVFKALKDANPRLTEMLQEYGMERARSGSNSEVSAARDGLPSSSKLQGANATPKKVVGSSGDAAAVNLAVAALSRLSKPSNESKEPAEKPTEKVAEKATEKPTETPPQIPMGGRLEPADVNSSTHRAAHARLTRRMQTLDPAAFPHMTKLWAGNRKDRFRVVLDARWRRSKSC